MPIYSYVCSGCGASVQAQEFPDPAQCPIHRHRFFGGGHSWRVVGQVTSLQSNQYASMSYDQMEDSWADSDMCELAQGDTLPAPGSPLELPRHAKVATAADTPEADLDTQSTAPSGEHLRLGHEAFAEDGQLATVVEVLASVGDTIAKDQVVCVVDTPRWQVELVFQRPGTLSFIASVGAKLGPNSVVATLEET